AAFGLELVLLAAPVLCASLGERLGFLAASFVPAGWAGGLALAACAFGANESPLTATLRSAAVAVAYLPALWGFGRGAGLKRLVQDGDLEYDPEDYPKLIAPILSGATNVVYGSRYLNPDNPLPWTAFKVAVLSLNAMANLLYGTRLTDEATCYKVFRRSLLQSLPLKCERFEFCPEVTARVAKRG